VHYIVRLIKFRVVRSQLSIPVNLVAKSVKRNSDDLATALW